MNSHINAPKINGGGTLEIKEHNELTECSLDVHGDVCSTKQTVKSVKKFLLSRNIKNDITTDEKVMSAAKKELYCDTEECVLKNRKIQSYVDEKLIKESLDRIKPDGPGNSTRLTSNKDLDGILDKLSKIHNFYHIPFQMKGFSGKKKNGEWVLEPTELGRIDIVEDVIKKGYDSFGVIMNTDIRSGGGLHWYALYGDIKKHQALLIRR